MILILFLACYFIGVVKMLGNSVEFGMVFVEVVMVVFGNCSELEGQRRMLMNWWCWSCICYSNDEGGE